MARSITDPYEQVEALAAMTRTLAEAGQREQAAAMASQAETVARSITDPYKQVEALAAVAEALAKAGQHEQAAAIAPRPRPRPAPSLTGGSRIGRWRRWPGR